MEETQPEIEDAPVGFKSIVWKYFGWPVKRDQDGNRVTDKSTTICKLCYTRVPYTGSSATNMTYHLGRHHKDVKTVPQKKTTHRADNDERGNKSRCIPV